MSFAKKWANPSGTKTYYAWRSMRLRCYNSSNPSFHHYGGRGIVVCERWINDYDAFYSDMGECPNDMSLDRIDPNGNYEPNNCRWATQKQQSNNQRRSRKLSIGGETLTITEWAEKIGIRADTLFGRINRGKASLTDAMSPKSLRDGWEHGTRQGYEGHKCRCDQCTASNTRRHKERRARLLRKITESSAMGSASNSP